MGQIAHATCGSSGPFFVAGRPLRFRRLLLASLDNRCSLATAPHCGADSAPSSSPVVRCASAGSYSLRSTIGARSPRHRTAAPIRPLLRRRSPAALPPAPPRFAPQSVLARHGTALRRRFGPFFVAGRPLRFRRLLLASL